MSVIVQFAIFPLDKGESLSQYVAESIKIVENSGLPYKTGPMGTSIEGEWQEVMDVITNCFETLKQKSKRIYLTLTADYRKDKSNRINQKTASVENKIGHKINT